MTFELFVWYMILAHFIGDYVLKTEWLSATKGKEWYNMLVHCILYTGSVSWVLINWTNCFPYFGMLCLFVSHWLIDTWKCDMSREATGKWNEKRLLYYDQFAHFMNLVGLIIWYR